MVLIGEEDRKGKDPNICFVQSGKGGLKWDQTVVFISQRMGAGQSLATNRSEWIKGKLMEVVPKKRDCEAICGCCGKYGAKNGALYRLGRNGYRAGYIYNIAAIETAVSNHEEEMRCMVEEFV